MREPRTAVMILVVASWRDQNGTLQSIPARILDKSSGGVCIQLKRQVGIGSRLSIHGRWEQFSGITKYCRCHGKEYLVGIQRETAVAAAGAPPAQPSVPQPEFGTRRDLPLPIAMRPTAAAARTEIPRDPSRTPAHQLAELQQSPAGCENPAPDSPDLGVLPQAERLTKPPTAPAEGERNLMRRNWLDMAPWHNKQEGIGGETNPPANKTENEQHWAAPVTAAAEKTATIRPAESAVSYEVELLPVEDVYRAEGIANPRKGYGIGKVIEMLRSEHLSGLSADLRRAALLMALHAAGISIGEVLTDAKARQQALDSYESERKKKVEAEWARRTEQNVQIEAELERIKAQYRARISRNLEAIEREKATFVAWQAKKQEECQDMSDAADLCLQKTPAEPVSSPEPTALAATAK